MARSYEDLLREYRSLLTARQRREFLRQHPNFANRLHQAGNFAGTVPDIDAIAATELGKPTDDLQHDPRGNLPSPWAPNLPGGFNDGLIGIAAPGGAWDPGSGGKPPEPDKTAPAIPIDIDGDGEYEGEMRDTNGDGQVDTYFAYESSNKPDPGRQNILDRLAQLLRDNELPDTLMGWIKESLAEGKSEERIMAELFELPEVKAAYPENELRKKNGLSWMPLAWIRDYRNKARTIARRVSGLDLSNSEIARFIANDRSLSEFESTMNTWERFKQWGPVVRAQFEFKLGRRITDAQAFALISNEIPSPEIEEAYEDALYTGLPAMLGLGIRPQEEADLLRAFGIEANPTALLRGYQAVGEESTRQQRLEALEKTIAGAENTPATLGQIFADTPWADAFRGIFLGDPQAIRLMQERMLRAQARENVGGGVAFEGSVARGLTTAADRQS